MEYLTRKISQATLDLKIFIDDVPNTLTFREYIREMEEELGMCPEPINAYSDKDLQEYLEELEGNLKSDANEI